MKFFEKTAYKKKDFKEDAKSLAAGAGAGIGAAALLNPIDIITKKSQNLAGMGKNETALAAKELSSYKNQLFHGSMGEKLDAWTLGLKPKALKVGGAAAVQFFLYNRIKKMMNNDR